MTYKSVTDPTPAQPERITPDELAYHATVIAQQRAMQAVVESWTVHLSRRYQLAPGDSVTDEGVIVRASSTAREGGT